MHDRWDFKTKAGLKDAPNVQAWSLHPDAVVPGSHPPRALYGALNRVKFNDLHTAIDQDRKGELVLETDEE